MNAIDTNLFFPLLGVVEAIATRFLSRHSSLDLSTSLVLLSQKAVRTINLQSILRPQYSHVTRKQVEQRLLSDKMRVRVVK